MKTFDSLAELTGMEHVPEVDIALVCASCCGGSIESASAFCDIFHKKLPGTKPVLFNQRFSDSDKVELIRKGVRGFFSIDMDSNRLEKALGVIKNGGVWTGPEDNNHSVPGEGAENGLLSLREKETLEAMAMGLKNKEIAAKLDISEVTVKSHVNRIYKKFGVDNRARAILFAMENNLLEEGDKKED
jgi:DNA-binding NarL/FixJ family response regulator